MLTSHEMSLRNISRKDVLNALEFRFCGYYKLQKRKGDCVDFILKTHKFSSIQQWCLWKCDLDYKFLVEYHSMRNKNLYCSGCGTKCTRFQAKNSTIFYQKLRFSFLQFYHQFLPFVVLHSILISILTSYYQYQIVLCSVVVCIVP